ncbi:MAG: hypothetical protein ACPG51_17670, partial [Thiolinea sp.]
MTFIHGIGGQQPLNNLDPVQNTPAPASPTPPSSSSVQNFNSASTQAPQMQTLAALINQLLQLLSGGSTQGTGSGHQCPGHNNGG